MSRYALLFTAALATFAIADDCGDNCDNYDVPSTTTTWDAPTTSAAVWEPVNTWDPIPTWTSTTTSCDEEDDETTTWDAYTWSNVPVTNTETDTWSPYPTPSWTGKPKHPHGPKHGDKGKGKKIIITITETYKVPCETGWATSTSTIYDTWCGCKETPKPEHPKYTTYTTECPESWNVGKTVTVTVPVATWTPPAVTSDYVPLESATWAAYGSASTWANYVSNTDTASTWATWGSASVPVAAASSCGYSTTAVVTTVCSQWADWDTSKTGAATACATSTSISTIYPTTCTGTWASWAGVSATNTATWATYTAPAGSSTGAWSPVATFKGAAPSTGINAAIVAVAGAVAGFAYLL